LTLQTIGILLTAITVSIAAIYYTLTLRYTRRNQDLQLETRQAQLFMQVYDRWQDPQYWSYWADIQSKDWEDYDSHQEKYGRSNNLDAWTKSATLFAFYEGLGVLVKRGLIDPHLVDDLLGGTVVRYWEKWGLHYREMRKRENYPQIAEQIEYLYHVIKPILEKENRRRREGYSLLDDLLDQT